MDYKNISKQNTQRRDMLLYILIPPAFSMLSLHLQMSKNDVRYFYLNLRFTHPLYNNTPKHQLCYAYNQYDYIR